MYNLSSVECFTDAECPELNGEDSSSDVNEMSGYSSQLLLTVFLNASRFRNLSYKKDLCPVAKRLNVKARGLGKYQLANKLATALVEKQFVQLKVEANLKCLKREELAVLKSLDHNDIPSDTCSRESSDDPGSDDD